MTIGIVNVISVDEMHVITYAFVTYELALAQAKELQKGVEYEIEEIPEETTNGLRRKVYKLWEPGELVVVQEIQLGDEILEVE